MCHRSPAKIGLVGLGVMGSAYTRNLLFRGFDVSAWTVNEKEIERIHETLKNVEVQTPKGKLCCFTQLGAFVESLEKPRKILMFITAGSATDNVIESLVKFLDADDILIDGGNEWYENTQIRLLECKKLGIRYCGMGVSGGEFGARNHPCLMFGGDFRDYEAVKEILQQDSQEFYIGPGAAGHHVKMVHNGVEYAIMQVISEICMIMKSMMGLKNDTISELLRDWDGSGEEYVSSYLLRITYKIFQTLEPNGKGYLLDKIEDFSESKGTGKWTVKEALDRAIPVPSISVAVEMRNTSNMIKIPQMIDRVNANLSHDVSEEDLKRCLLGCTVSIIAQGFSLLSKASEAFEWSLKLQEIAKIWSKNSIISCRILGILASECSCDGILHTPSMLKIINENLVPWKKVAKSCIDRNMAVPCIVASLQYIYTMSSKHLGHNLVQAQRDFFGAHGFLRVDRSGRHSHKWPQT